MSSTAYSNSAIRPIQHGASTSDPPLYLAGGYSPLVTNCRIHQNSLRKRPGTKLYRNVGRYVYGIYLYQTTDGTRATLVLTDTDLIKIEPAGTWSYLTQTYATGTITNITGATLTGDSTAWNTSGVAAGDKFILNDDLGTEPDANWATVQSVGGATSITLSGSYTGTTGAMSKTYRIRKVYSVPADERWFTATVSGKFCFGNGNVPVQYWAGTGYAQDLNAALALHARYGIEYANRLFLGDVDVMGTRSAITLRWSKENDPTTWVDSTAGELDLQDSDDFIKGLGKVGDNLVIYENRHILPYARTGNATSPISIVATRSGMGVVAPYSILSVEGANVFIGANDFYVMDSDNPLPMDAKIRHLFYDITGGTEIKKVFGGVNPNRSEWYWAATTSQGQYVLTYDWKVKDWIIAQFPGTVSAFGMGAI